MILVLAVWTAPVHARTAETTMAVSAHVPSSCSISASPMAFGTPADFTQPQRSSAAILLSCTPFTDYRVEVDHGQNAQGGQRRMFSPATGQYLPYRIFSDAGYGEPVAQRRGNDVTAGMAGSMTGTTGPTGRVQVMVYGETSAMRLIGGMGAYVDTVVITVAF